MTTMMVTDNESHYHYMNSLKQIQQL